MAKPWGRYEIGFLDHPKFTALNANAFRLWWEGKQYCDRYHTDGLIPASAVKAFRYRSPEAIRQLTASCGQKTHDVAYAALWERHDIGYKMHDYLDHNDCREVVLARKGAAEERREAERRRKADWRAAKAERRQQEDRRDMSREMSHGTESGTVPSVSRSTTETPTPTATKEAKEGEAHAPPRPRPMAPIHDRSHLKHAECGRVCLHASQFNEFVRRRNHDGADLEVRDWAHRIIRAWTDGAHAQDEPGEQFDFWRARYAEQWPPAAASQAPAPFGKGKPSGPTVMDADETRKRYLA